MEQLNGYGDGIYYAWMSDRRRTVLVERDEGGSTEFELPDLCLRLPLVDRFPDGRILVASSVSKWRSPDDFDRNGFVVDPTTNSQSEILLGDGVASISIDSLGRIWVSYNDVGVFGGLGWGHPGPAPVGASGLNCFDINGNILWRFPGDADVASNFDCYAMNVHDQTAAVYYYREFPLCVVSSDFQVSSFETELKGRKNFAIDDSLVLFSGQYHDAPSIGHLAVLGNDRLQEYQEVEFILPDKSPLSSGRLISRGAEMHYVDKTGWYNTKLVDGNCR